MTIHRRKFLHTALGVAAGILVVPLKALAARPQDAFDQKSSDDVMKSLFNSTATDSSHVTINCWCWVGGSALTEFENSAKCQLLQDSLRNEALACPGMWSEFREQATACCFHDLRKRNL